ncbi:DNA cytosine methyltransferase (plasmid) [Streptomyces sp. CWNU-52B]|uniref:DNA cytosine methyltransferase n=1 Tax=unclassified Streptomyces TaxID=2593676 RepID=UPI0039C3EFDA
MTIRIGSLCSGYRGLDQAVEDVFGGTTAWVSDIDPGANRILAHRWPTTPNIGDLRFAHWGRVLRQYGPVDVVCGGYPCQPFSTAGQRKGTDDARHIWPFIARALGVLRPRVAIFENVAGHLRLGFDVVLADLARLGFDVEWCLVRADEVGAPHQRKRLFIVATAADAANLGHERDGSARGWRPGPTDHGQSPADTDRGGLPGHSELPAGRNPLRQRERNDAHGRHTATAAHSSRIGRREGRPESARQQGRPGLASRSPQDWGQFTPAIARWEEATGRPAPWATDDRRRLSPAFVEWMMGLPAGHVTDVPGLTRTQQLKALGNGVVPQQAAAALRVLYARAAPGTFTSAA